MIIFDKFWLTMKNKGITTYVLREKHNIDSTTIKRLRLNRNITTATLNKLCKILDCRLDEIAEYIPD